MRIKDKDPIEKAVDAFMFVLFPKKIKKKASQPKKHSR